MSVVSLDNQYQLTEAEYLQSEQKSVIKHEFIDGYIYAMAGASSNHNFISGNVYRKFGNHLEGSKCAPFMADMKVKIGTDFVYPDVLVDCGNISGDDYFSSTPIIIVEVLSKSSRKTDLTLKLIRNINIPSLEEYVLIEQDIVSIQVLRRNNQWRSEYFFLGDTVNFASIGLNLTVEEIYDRVDNAEMRDLKLQL